MKGTPPLGTCFELTDEIVQTALRPAESLDDQGPRARVFALLDHLTKIARPKQGAPKILLVLARLATCDWIDGALEVRVIGHDGRVSIELFVDDGLSLTKMRAPLEIQVPYEEFRKAVAARPDALRPLVVAGQIGPSKLRLTAGAPSDEDEAPKSAVASAMFRAARPVPPPADTPREEPDEPPKPSSRRSRTAPKPAVIGRVALEKRTVSRSGRAVPPAPTTSTSKRGKPRTVRPPKR